VRDNKALEQPSAAAGPIDLAARCSARVFCRHRNMEASHTEDDDTLARAARLIQVGFATGSLSRARAVAWADRALVACSDPPTWLIDLSMTVETMRPSDCLNALHQASRGSEHDAFAAIALWHEAVSIGDASPFDACANLAGIRVPAWPRRLAAQLVESYHGACDQASRA